MTNNNFPYPTPFEVIRCVALVLDVKNSSKKLDDVAYHRYYNPNDVSKYIQKFIAKPLEKAVDKTISDVIQAQLEKSLSTYSTEIVAKQNAEGVSRQNMLTILCRSFIKEAVADTLTALFSILNQDKQSFTLLEAFNPSTANNHTFIGAIFDWLDKHESEWSAYQTTLTKEEKDKQASWKRGDKLASLQSIILLEKQAPKDICIDWSRAKFLFLIARSLDFIKKQEHGELLITEVAQMIQGKSNNYDAPHEILTQKTASQISDIEPDIAFLLVNMMRTEKKTASQSELKNRINKVQHYMNERPECQSLTYRNDWLLARWFVASGELKKAKEQYKKAFENSLFTAGNKQEELIHEALVVTAIVKPIDKLLLKQLKWSLINFGYDISSSDNNPEKNTFANHVEDWEVEHWQASFYTLFPKQGFFPQVQHKDESYNSQMYVDTSQEIEPDYRNLDRKIKIGNGSQTRRMPQLQWFLMNRQYDVVIKLLDKGASVNVKSEVGDTPLLIALNNINAEDCFDFESDKKMFDLICQHEHKQETIASRTIKKRNIAIISAIETGKPDIVKALLDMGADPNQHGKTDSQTPLHRCFSLIARYKNPEKFYHSIVSAKMTPEMFDAMRRYNPDLPVKMPMINPLNNLRGDNNLVLNQIYKIKNKIFIQNTTLESLRAIATLLIEHGADVNAEVKSPIKGYTPMMQAAEEDEAVLFTKILKHGGDLSKSYFFKPTQEHITCKEIAEEFKANNVLKVIHNY